MISRVLYFPPVFSEPPPLPTLNPTTQSMAFLPVSRVYALFPSFLTDSLWSRSTPHAMFIFPHCCPAGLCCKLARPSLLPLSSSQCSRPYLSVVFPLIQTCLTILFQQWPVPSMPVVIWKIKYRKFSSISVKAQGTGSYSLKVLRRYNPHT